MHLLVQAIVLALLLKEEVIITQNFRVWTEIIWSVS